MLDEEILREAFLDLMSPEDRKVWTRLFEEMDKFDVSSVKDESHLRNIIMERVLESAEHMFTVSTNRGRAIVIKDLPEDVREERLDDLMTKILEDIQGPGPALRHRIATLILHYRMLLRFRTMLSSLTPSSPNYRKTLNGIKHIETTIRMAMFMLYSWPLERDDKKHKELLATQEKILQTFTRNPDPETE
jgi:hypothetical protein